MTDATDGKNNLAEERKAIKKNPPKVIMCARLEERTQSGMEEGIFISLVGAGERAIWVLVLPPTREWRLPTLTRPS